MLSNIPLHISLQILCDVIFSCSDHSLFYIRIITKNQSKNKLQRPNQSSQIKRSYTNIITKNQPKIEQRQQNQLSQTQLIYIITKTN